MTKKEYIIEEPFELTATPISWLEGIAIEDLSADDILLIVSQPNYQVQDTGYISKKAKLKDIKDSICESLSVDLINQQIEYLSTEMSVLAEINGNLNATIDGSVYLNNGNMTIANPYVLSSITFGSGNISSIAGYNLKDALSAIIPNNKYSIGKFGRVDCTTLRFNDNSTMTTAVVPATENKYGTVKIKDGDFVIDGDKIYVSKDSNGLLFVSINSLTSTIKSAIESDILDTVRTELKKTFYQTTVVPNEPSTLEANTIYYVYST